MDLPQNVVENILMFKEDYIKYRKGKEGERFEKERQSREKEIRNIFKRENLKNLDEISLLTLANNLDATSWWYKKEYRVKTWIDGAGGIDNLRKYFEELIYSNRRFADRYDNFRKNVKGLGAGIITETLTYLNPREYGIWNSKVKEALVKLGLKQLDNDVIVSKLTRISGREYEAIIKCLKQIAVLLRDEKSLPDPDLLDVDQFLYYLVELQYTDKVSKGEGFGHEEIVVMLMNIGMGLGFDAVREVPLMTGTRIDVVWSTRIGNLGELKYVFEVHVKGSVDSLTVNLLRASQDPAVQKVVAVSSEDELEKIRKQVSTIKQLSDKILFWDVVDVEKVSGIVESLINMMRRLGLTRS